MAEDKPLISIVMAVYHPRKDWLAEQLDSLNAQTYPNLELIVCDDGPDAPVEESVFAEHITAFPWELVRNEENLGSNKTFERLTTMARGEYIAYCDQDDIWLPQKLDELIKIIQKGPALLVCSDVIVIDETGRKMADSITHIRKRHIFKSGLGLAPSLLLRNFVMGCTMLVCAETAKTAVPFVDHMVHDHWIALWAAYHGAIAIAEKPLIEYRIHGGNQTSVLSNIGTKEDYIKERISPYVERTWELHGRVYIGAVQDVVDVWAKAREDYAHRVQGAGCRMWKLRKINLPTTLFELIMFRAPKLVFLWAVRMIRDGKI